MSPAPPGRDDLPPPLDILARARGAHPQLDIDESGFFDHLTRVAGGSPDVAALAIEDLALAYACGKGDHRAIAELERRHIAEVPRALARLRPSNDLIEEVKQSLREKLLVSRNGERPRIEEYAGRGPLGAWIRVAALRAAISMRRGVAVEDEAPLREVAERSLPPEVVATRARYRAHLKRAVETAVEGIDPSDRELLRRFAIEGATVEQLGKEAGVHGSTISRKLARIRKTIREQTHKLAGAVRLDASELTSVVRVLRSDLDVSMLRLLGGGRG